MGVLTKIIVEFIGTFIFLSVILSSGEAIPIGVALTAVILFGGNISGGHYNPAVSTMMLLKDSINLTDYSGYIVAQLLGGIAAYYFHKNNYIYSI